MKRTKSWRRHKTNSIINKRLNLIKEIWYGFADNAIKRFKKERHYLSKKHPCDCGKSQCKLCNYEKIFNIENPHDIKRSKIEIEDEYYLDTIDSNTGGLL